MLCPWFPVEAVMTPRALSSPVIRESRLMPPLILKAPIGWWFSCFTHASHPSTLERPW